MSIQSINSQSGVLSNQLVEWRVVQGITTIMELKMISVLNQFDAISNLMYGALMHKDQ